MSNSVVNDWDALLTVAVLGTERRQIPADSTDSLLDELKAVKGLSNEGALLGAAAATAITMTVGFGPQKNASLEIEPAPPEEFPYVGRAAQADLDGLLEKIYLTTLADEWLETAKKQRKILPPHMVPTMLNIATSSIALRKKVLPLCGNRAAWLAKFNKEWSWAGASEQLFTEESIQQIWETGEPEERLELIRTLIKTHRERALQLLETTWAQETVTVKTNCLDELQMSLTIQDEAFLETCLHDKRKEVRTRAIQLLRSLPGANYSRLMAEKCRPYFHLKSKSPIKFEVKLPEALDKDLERICRVPYHTPKAAEGARAFMLFRLIGSVRPDLWPEIFDVPADDLVKAAELDDEWGQLILAAWTESGINLNNDQQWAELMLRDCLDHEVYWMFKTIPEERQIEIVSSMIRDSQRKLLTGKQLFSKQVNADAPIPKMLSAMEYVWPEEFSKFIFNTVLLTQRDSFDKNREASKELCVAMEVHIHPSVGELIINAPDSDRERISILRAIKEFSEFIDTMDTRWRIWVHLTEDSNGAELNETETNETETNETDMNEMEVKDIGGEND